MNRLNDLVDDTRIRQRRRITQLILLTRQNLPENSPHSLAGSRLGQVGDGEDGLGGRERTDGFPDLEDEVLLELLVDLVAVLDRDEGVDGLAGEFVGCADNSCLGDTSV